MAWRFLVSDQLCKKFDIPRNWFWADINGSEVPKDLCVLIYIDLGTQGFLVPLVVLFYKDSLVILIIFHESVLMNGDFLQSFRSQVESIIKRRNFGNKYDGTRNGSIL